MMTSERCQWCNQEKMPLPERTEKKGLPVFVCASVVGKAKAPCDGPVYRNATKNA